MATDQKTTTKNTKRVRTGEHATTIFVYWQDKEGEKGITPFKTKPDLDTWLASTTVNVLMVIRGRERKVSRRIVFQ